MIEQHRSSVWAYRCLLDRVLFCALLVFAVCLAVMTSGCKTAGVATPPSATAPAVDPYATALKRLNEFSQVLLDVKISVAGLHTTQIAWSDGTLSPVLSDDAYTKVNTGLSFLSAEGTKLSNLLAARATPAQISTEMAAMTAGLAAQLSPTAVGIKNPAAQQRYSAITGIVSISLNLLATYIALIPAEEASYDFSRNLGLDPVVQSVGSHDPHGDRSDREGSASVAEDRPRRFAGPGQRQLRQGTRDLAARLV